MPLITVERINEALKRGNLIFFLKETIVLTKDRFNVPTITNTPLHPKNFRPVLDRMEIECMEKRVRAGQHMHYIVVKLDQRTRQMVQREILA